MQPSYQSHHRMKLLLEEVVVLLGGGAVVMQPGGQTTECTTVNYYFIQTSLRKSLSLESDTSSLLNSPLESFREVAELQTCPLKLCLQKFLAAHELLSQTLHPYGCLHQTLMQTYILLLQRPVTGMKHCLVPCAAQSST